MMPALAQTFVIVLAGAVYIGLAVAVLTPKQPKERL